MPVGGVFFQQITSLVGVLFAHPVGPLCSPAHDDNLLFGGHFFQVCIHGICQNRIIIKVSASGNHQTEAILPDGLFRLVPHHQKANQFKIIQPLDFVCQKADLVPAQKTADITFFFDLNDRSNGIPQKAGNLIHPFAVVGLFVEGPVQRGDGFGFPFAQVAHFIQHLFWGKMVADNFSIGTDVHHIKGMQTVLVIDVHTAGTIFQHKNHAGRHIGCRSCHRM